MNIKRKISILLFFILEFLILYLEKKYINLAFAVDRLIIFTSINLFICMHLFFDIRKMYDFIFHKRYYIVIIILLYVTIMKYSGSSITFWNGIIQPNHPVESGSIVLGTPRDIRGDEFFVSTPTNLSQKFNNFNFKSNKLMGRKESVVLFPSLPSKHISILGRLWDLPYLFLPIENAFAFSWFFRFFLVFMASFELCLLVTKQKRLYSLLGAVLITLSGANCWWSNMNILGVGALAVILFSQFLKTDKISFRLLYSVLLGIVGASYILLMYPAWQVPFAYVYLCFIIWILYENRDKIKPKLLLYIPIVIFVIAIIVVPAFWDSTKVYALITSTVYPGSRLSVGGQNKERLFSYYLNLFYSFKNFFNPSEYSNFLSLYPLPVIICIFNGIKKIKNKMKFDLLLSLMTILAILLSIWNFVKIPALISKITLLSWTTDGRTQLAVGYLCIFIIIRLFSLYEKKYKISIFQFLACLIISIVFNLLCILFINSYFDEYYTKDMILISLIIFIPIVCAFLLNNKKINKYLSIFLIILSIITGLSVNPISKGLGVFYNKPVSKKIQTIKSKNAKARWIVVNSNYAIPNYVLANGVIVVNSTNFYPNMDLWKKFDKNLKKEYIYNRFAHVRINLTTDKTKFELLYEDSFMLNLNVDNLDKMNVQYVLSMEDVGEILGRKAYCIYSEDGIYIYKVS